MSEFTSREQQVFALLGEGLSNPEIAERMDIAVKTVEANLAHMCNKRDCTTRQLRYEAIRQHVLAEAQR